MTKYINANSFLEYEENRCKNFPPLIGTCSFDNATLRGELMNFPAADVKPVRHGYWEIGYFHDRVCSCCTHPDNDLDDYPHPYCPNCGAKMDKEGKK